MRKRLSSRRGWGSSKSAWGRAELLVRTASWGRDSMPPPASESRERRGCALGIASVLFPGWTSAWAAVLLSGCVCLCPTGRYIDEKRQGWKDGLGARSLLGLGRMSDFPMGQKDIRKVLTSKPGWPAFGWGCLQQQGSVRWALGGKGQGVGRKNSRLSAPSGQAPPAASPGHSGRAEGFQSDMRWEFTLAQTKFQ